ncbi:subtilisin-like protein [Coccomyxa subellipsoidea C-169]|uniref:Subtilisin-like protein n=1 Tax=Coccomyxa subellipsoidea (strain C-169) TaxID=574566 RepID=I0YKM3_COCSC|nr:subtilisin-like protein [Coccomyxa subellipsoidea C-169]EIE18942.1 subtilisin-like protein [Coccomyxa subellipsoidea C-169]|eukprot:XP_005643486.1 subtilisin-like protein [Coccomyxa subellipsoidea C-169]
MKGSRCNFLALTLALLPFCCLGEGVFDNFRLLIQRPNSAGVFSGDFNGGKTEADPLTALQRTFAGSIVPLEVFQVNTSLLSPQALCEFLIKFNPEITICEPDQKVKVEAPSATPNDPLYAQQWNMKAIGVDKAWAKGQLGDPQRRVSTSQVRVCMVDTGIDITHPDLVNNLWINPVEMAGPGATAANGYQNGIDDDGNGIIDDIHGADFVNGGKDGNIQDQNGHGTFVAGVVGAMTNNGLGVAGINQYASLVGCRFMDATGNGWVSDAIRCFEYCLSKDTQVLSNSWGGVDYSKSLQAALDHLSARGALVVASAGNEGVNTDTTPHYPSSLPDDIIMAVGAATRQNALWARSNYGTQTVHIMAPGVNVLSTGLGGLYVQLTGTSMATPHVAGTAALLLAQYLKNGWEVTTKAPNKGLASQLKKIIMQSAKKVNGASIKSGLLDTAAALALVPLKPTTESIGAFSSDFARPEGNVTSDGGAANTTVVALAPAVDWSATFDPNQPGAAASSGGSSGSDAASPSSANSWLPNFPSDLFYPSPPTPPASETSSPINVNGSSTTAHPWDLPSNRPLMPGDSLASIEKRVAAAASGSAASAEAAAPPQTFLDKIFGRRLLAGAALQPDHAAAPAA